MARPLHGILYSICLYLSLVDVLFLHRNRNIFIWLTKVKLWTNRLRSLMQTEKSKPEGKRIMPETRFTDFPALSVDSRVGISRSASKTDE